MLADPGPSSAPPPSGAAAKRKRRPAGTPDPDAEVVSLSPRTLMESDRYVCDICNQGFQREQNLQMHRRRHKVPWRLLKRGEGEAAAPSPRRRVFVCPDESCLHHDRRHALGDLVGIKKHYRRKHSERRQWGCARCGKAYAVQSDYKAHLRTCGTRGHSCDCGRVFSRVESFIEHQGSCKAGRRDGGCSQSSSGPADVNVELQLLPATRLVLSVGPGDGNREEEQPLPDTTEKLRLAADEKAIADETRRQARAMVEQAEKELADAKRVRQQALGEVERALAMRDEVAEQVKAILLSITCHDCRRGRAAVPSPDDEVAGDQSTV